LKAGEQKMNPLSRSSATEPEQDPKVSSSKSTSEVGVPMIVNPFLSDIQRSRIRYELWIYVIVIFTLPLIPIILSFNKFGDPDVNSLILIAAISVFYTGLLIENRLLSSLSFLVSFLLILSYYNVSSFLSNSILAVISTFIYLLSSLINLLIRKKQLREYLFERSSFFRHIGR
jgi:hypothetical protein